MRKDYEEAEEAKDDESEEQDQEQGLRFSAWGLIKLDLGFII